MNTDADLLRRLPLETFDHPLPGDAWARSPLADASDARLLAAAVAAITPPKCAAPSSFVLHAPLELLARAALLPWVDPASRPGARRRLAEVAVRYAQAGAEVEAPDAIFATAEAALAALIDALRSGDATGADAALCFVLPRLPLQRLRAVLVDHIAPRLGAASHAPILLAALPAVAERVPGVAGLLRAPLRTLAASADRLSWFREAGAVTAAVPVDPSRALADALAAPPRVASPSSSIAPTLLAVERSGDAARLLAGPVRALTLAEAQRVLLRVAAHSMLQDDPARAAYGWTHCLTLPQALLANADAAADAHALIAVAATQVLGFRATLGRVALDLDALPAPPGRASVDSTAAAAGAAFHTPLPGRTALMTALATRASLHADAHLAKYTLACFEAAARDPDAAPLFLAAAAYLGAWWAARAPDNAGS